jgi:hypothetical protein
MFAQKKNYNRGSSSAVKASGTGSRVPAPCAFARGGGYQHQLKTQLTNSNPEKTPSLKESSTGSPAEISVGARKSSQRHRIEPKADYNLTWA